MSLYKARICAIGTEADICRLLRAMLDNIGMEEEEAPVGLEALTEQTRKMAHAFGPDVDDFSYEMVTRRPWGDALPETLRLQVRPAGGVATIALFSYDSEDPFQTHDWLALHRACGNTLMVALRAGEGFAAEKGAIIFAGGEAEENWTHASECWLWLTQRERLFGVLPEEALRLLRQLNEELEEEFSDREATQLLRDTMNLLTRLSEAASAEDLPAQADAATQRHDFDAWYRILFTLANAALWETERIAKWQACAEAILDFEPR